MPENAQFMIGVPEATKDRMDALRIVMGISRAEVGRLALESKPGGLAVLERANAARLKRLDGLAATYGYPHWNALVWYLVNRYGQKMPTLEALEMPEGKLIEQHGDDPAGGADRAPEVTATFSG